VAAAEIGPSAMIPRSRQEGGHNRATGYEETSRRSGV
jgi:hypothetical protein